MSKSVFCIVGQKAQAEAIVRELKAESFSSNDVSILMQNGNENMDLGFNKQNKALEAGRSRTASGSTFGVALDWLAGIGAISLPGVGHYIAAGPIMASLNEVADESAHGGITGSLIGMGIPEYEAKRYEGKIRRGNILISVHTEDEDEVMKARVIFEKLDGQDIASTEEISVPHQTT